MLEITNSVLNSIIRATEDCTVEQGFILGCASRLDRIDVCEQITAVQAGLYFYSPDTKNASKVVRSWSENDICFCGFIHSHRTNKNELSEADLQFAERLLASFQMPFLWFGLLIITENCVESVFYKLYYRNEKPVLRLTDFIIREESKTKRKDPPTEDVYILGCCGSVECGYWSLEYYTDNSGHMEIRKGVCHCDYLGKTVKEFSQCPYAKEYPNILRPGIFGN